MHHASLKVRHQQGVRSRDGWSGMTGRGTVRGAISWDSIGIEMNQAGIRGTNGQFRPVTLLLRDGTGRWINIFLIYI